VSTTSDFVNLLSRHKTLASAPQPELEWCMEHGSLKSYEAGTILTPNDQPIEELYIVLTGHICFYGGEQTGHRHKIIEWIGGDVAGLLPYSRMTKSPGFSVIEEPSDILSINREHFPEMIRECPVVTATPSVSQCADTHRIAFGRGSLWPRALQARRTSVSSTAFMGEPWPAKTAGMVMGY